MPIKKRFVVTKDANTNTITYAEYEKLKGYNVKPKKELKIEDMINVNEMIIINPSLIDKLIDKKIKRSFEKILKMLNAIDEDEDGTLPINLVLDEVEKLKVLAMQKYKKYMEEEKYELLMKKIKILEQEVRLRQEREEIYTEKKGKRGR